MTNWIKPSELPDDFWGECFVGWKDKKSQEIGDFDRIVTVKNGERLQWYSEILHDWFEFREQHEYRVLPIVYPVITKEDFQ